MAKILVDEDTTFCPSEWMDEVVPCRVAHPDELLKLRDGAWTIEVDDDDNEEGDEHYTRTRLTDGQVVGFLAHRSYGSFKLVVFDDGKFATNGYPDDANYFQLEDGGYEDFWPSLDELVAEGNEGGRVDPGTYTVDCWYWSEEEVNFRFEIVDGKGHFTRVESMQ